MVPSVTPSPNPLLLYTAGTPNGHKVSIFLEELRTAYPGLVDYDVHAINMSKDEQKEPWYLKINPNGRIPALVHRRPDGTEFAVFESAAILLYLGDLYDKEHKITFPRGSDEESEALQWIFFAHGGVGPMQGQATWFTRSAPEKIPYAINRYINESKRLYSVLNDRLKDRDWLVGPGKGVYSIADINVWPWVSRHAFSGIESIDEFPHFSAWIERVRSRPQVTAGCAVPPPKPH